MSGYAPTTALPTGTTSGQTKTEYERIYVLHASVPVYSPAPGGGDYCTTATCIHNHADTVKGRMAAKDCADRLARFVAKGRLPQWARLAAPLPQD
jgi:hypothetical protein